jgi:hypothetical protein
MRRCLTLLSLCLLLPVVAAAQVGPGPGVFQSGPSIPKLAGTWTLSDPLSLRGEGTAAAKDAQSMDFYNFCDGWNGTTCATGYQKAVVGWDGNATFIVTTSHGGTGAATYIKLAAANGVLASGIYPPSDNAYTKGSAALRWKDDFTSQTRQGSTPKTLVDAAAAVSFARVAIPADSIIGGAVHFTAESNDGASKLGTSGAYKFSAVNVGGTVTCGSPVAFGTPSTVYPRANTLVCTVSAVTATTNCDLQVTCTDNKAGDQAPTFKWHLDIETPTTVTPIT